MASPGWDCDFAWFLHINQKMFFQQIVDLIPDLWFSEQVALWDHFEPFFSKFSLALPKAFPHKGFLQPTNETELNISTGSEMI